MGTAAATPTHVHVLIYALPSSWPAQSPRWASLDRGGGRTPGPRSPSAAASGQLRVGAALVGAGGARARGVGASLCGGWCTGKLGGRGLRAICYFWRAGVLGVSHRLSRCDRQPAEARVQGGPTFDALNNVFSVQPLGGWLVAAAAKEYLQAQGQAGVELQPIGWGWGWRPGGRGCGDIRGSMSTQSPQQGGEGGHISLDALPPTSTPSAALCTSPPLSTQHTLREAGRALAGPAP